MTRTEYLDFYQNYIACLNTQNWSRLQDYVGLDVTYNGERLGLTGYKTMLKRDFEHIPDLQFNVQLLLCDPPFVMCRLNFNCTPLASFLGLPVNGQKVSFTENVIYEIRNQRILNVWSVIDKAAIEVQLQKKNGP